MLKPGPKGNLGRSDTCLAIYHEKSSLLHSIDRPATESPVRNVVDTRMRQPQGEKKKKRLGKLTRLLYPPTAVNPFHQATTTPSVRDSYKTLKP